MDVFQALRLCALQAILNPDREYSIRKILRWYSKNFYTPLAQVEELPFEDVFQAYYEEKYERMSPEELEEERRELLTTEDERRKAIFEEEAMEAELFEAARIIAAEEAKKRTAKPAPAGDLAKIQHQALGPIAKTAPEPDLPATKTLPPAITMTFIDQTEFEDLIEGPGLMDQPKKR